MTNSRASRGMVVLDKHEATGTEASYTFTPDPAILNDKYSKILIIFDGKTTASLALELKINGSATGHYWTMTENNQGTLTGSTASNASEFPLADTSVITAATHLMGEISLYLSDIATAVVSIDSTIGAGRHYNKMTGNIVTSTITEIKIQTSTSTWVAGTKIIIYGVVR